MKKSELTISLLLLPLDYLLLILAGVLAYALRLSKPVQELRPVIFDLPLASFLWILAPVALFWIIIFAFSGLYQIKTTYNFLEEIKNVILASSLSIMAIVIYIFSRSELFESRFIVITFWIFAVVLVSLGRLLVRWIQRVLAIKYGIGLHKILIIGNDHLSHKLAEEFRTNKSLGYKTVKYLREPSLEMVAETVGNPGIDEVLVASVEYPRERIIELMEFCYEKRLVFRFVPNLFQTLTANVSIDTSASVPLVELKRTKLEGWGKVIKRIFDIVCSLGGLILLSPLFIVVAFLIKWDSRGPVFVKLTRIKEGQAFALIKFRSMIENAASYKEILRHLNERSDGPLFKLPNDPRITKIGRILRKYRLDELPQLRNVLNGEMSLVGPRPHEPKEVMNYKKHHRKVLAIKPGITGLAQVSGSSDLLFEEEVRLDTYYIESWSLWLDIKILAKTLVVVFRDPSAV